MLQFGQNAVHIRIDRIGVEELDVFRDIGLFDEQDDPYASRRTVPRLWCWRPDHAHRSAMTAGSAVGALSRISICSA